MKPMWFALAAMAGLGLAVDAHAVGRLVDVNVVDRDSGTPLPIVRYHGRYYVAGEPGRRYRIELQSHRGDRVLGVVSVDGINAISGDTARWSQTGYVLDGYAGYAVLGWRKSDEQVASFFFTDPGQSYAGLTGRPDNVGVIGVAVFRERVRIAVREPEQAATPMEPAPAMETATAAPQAAKAAPLSRRALADDGSPLGTGHGEREHSLVHTVDFERAADTPDEVIAIYYDTRARLVARGILPSAPIHAPQAFPGHYAPDP
jgi:hypothetical protein